MTRAELIKKISEKTKYEQLAVKLMLESFEKIVKKSVSNGTPVYMRGFGVFHVKTRKAKKVQDMRKNLTIDYPETNIPAFKPYPGFCEAVKINKNIKIKGLSKNKKKKRNLKK